MFITRSIPNYTLIVLAYTAKQGCSCAAPFKLIYGFLFAHTIQNNIHCIYVDTCVCRVTAKRWQNCIICRRCRWSAVPPGFPDFQSSSPSIYSSISRSRFCYKFVLYIFAPSREKLHGFLSLMRLLAEHLMRAFLWCSYMCVSICIHISG